jgi:choline dehydrogenase
VQSGKTVLLIEAGGSDRSPFIQIPAAVWRHQSKHEWGYRSQPDPTRNGLIEEWHRGRVLGGTSSINGMVYVRGAAEDFDRWAALCDQAGGWAAADVMRLYQDIEHVDHGGDLRGTEGPLFIRTVRRPHTVTRAFVESARACGQAFNRDYNGGRQEGVGFLQFTQRRGLRWSAADAFVKPLRGKSNLTLLLNATVQRVQMNGNRAQAVEVKYRDQLVRHSATDVVLSAGTIDSPKLLMLSGIGEADELQRHHIELVLDRPAVGQGLKEHPLVQLTYRSKIPTNNLTQGISQKLRIAFEYLRYREGPIAAAYEAAAFLRTLPSAKSPEIQVFFAPIGWDVRNGAARLLNFPAVKCVILRSHALSSGRVRLADRDPAVPPLIEGRLLECEEDVHVLARGMEMVRGIFQRKPIADLIESELTPGASVSGLSALTDYVRAHAEPSCHPMGTCRMGADSKSVVEPSLRVRGTENLWIADASIMPDAISANLNAPCMMIGTKLGQQLASKA